MVALLASVLRRPGLGPVEREYTLTALMKLSARLSGVADKVQVRCVVVAQSIQGFYQLIWRSHTPQDAPNNSRGEATCHRMLHVPCSGSHMHYLWYVHWHTL